jgi:nucleoside 2-deoxyribosyltransferase
MVREMLQPELINLGFEVVNPFENLGRTNHFFSDTPVDLNSLAKEEQQLESAESVVKKETDMIRSCDILFAYMDAKQPSVGVCMEIFFNSVHLARGKEKTFVFIDTTNPDDYHLIHPWIVAHATVSNDLDKLFKQMDALR